MKGTNSTLIGFSCSLFVAACYSIVKHHTFALQLSQPSTCLIHLFVTIIQSFGLPILDLIFTQDVVCNLHSTLSIYVYVYVFCFSDFFPYS